MQNALKFVNQIFNTLELSGNLKSFDDFDFNAEIILNELSKLILFKSESKNNTNIQENEAQLLITDLNIKLRTSENEIEKIKDLEKFKLDEIEKVYEFFCYAFNFFF